MGWTREELEQLYRSRGEQPPDLWGEKASSLQSPKTERPALITDSKSIALPNAVGLQQHTPGVMNQTEEHYRDHLKLRMIAGEVLWYAFEMFTVKIGPDLRYTPDFTVMLANAALEFHEVKVISKGKPLMKDDARVKLIMLAQLVPMPVRLEAYDKQTGEFIETLIEKHMIAA